MRFLRIAPFIALSACAATEVDSLVEAHRGGAGYWPGNSLSAVRGTIAAGFDAIEVDLVLTKDGEAVLSHDPVLDPEHCTNHKGKALTEAVRFDSLRLNAVRDDFLCGGVADPDHPRAEVVAEPVMAFETMLSMLEDADPNLGVHLDIKYEQGWTPTAEDFAKAVLNPWWDASLPQPMWVSANTIEAIQAFESHAQSRGRDVHTVLIHPFAEYGGSAPAAALKAEGQHLLGKADYVQLLEEAGADGIAVHWEVAERGQVLRAHNAGYQVGLWTVNDPAIREALSGWPISMWITDYPGSL